MTKQPRVWDNSTISCFQTCRRKYYFRHVLHLQPKIKGTALLFGSAIHEGLDTYYITKDVEKAVDSFRANYQDREGDEIRTLAIGEKLLRTYAKKYANEPFTPIDKPEEGFVFPIGDILYGGRMDLPVDWDGQLWVVEHKTTTRLTGSYFDQFELDKQITGYIVGIEEYYGRKCTGCVLNVMEPWKEPIRKTSKTKAPFDHFLRKAIQRSTALKDRFKYNVQCIVRDILWCEENNEFQEAEKKEACFYYNRPCPFLNLCIYGADEKFIKRDYIVSKWEPFKLEGGDSDE
jgi:hypothetical protein